MKIGYMRFNLKARKGDLVYEAGWFNEFGKRPAKAMLRAVGIKAARKFLKLLKGLEYTVTRPNFSTLVIEYAT